MDKEKVTISKEDVGELTFAGDKMTIVGTDGKPKYELTSSNVTDLRNHCACGGSTPYQVNGAQRVCLVCGLPLT